MTLLKATPDRDHVCVCGVFHSTINNITTNQQKYSIFLLVKFSI